MKPQFFQLSDLRDLDLDLGLGHMEYCHVSLIDLYIYILTKYLSNREKLLVDGRTDVGLIKLMTGMQSGLSQC